MIKYIQRELSFDPTPRGIHLITNDIINAVPEIEECDRGILNVFIKHTSASLALNEDASPDVRTDLRTFLDDIVPDGYDRFTHTMEGPDDMSAHVKSILTGTELNLPISRGRLRLGRWQGIYLCEHRDRGGARTVVLTLHGSFSDSG